MENKWSPTTWQEKERIQMPEYEDQSELNEVKATLRSYPPLVSAGEINSLKQEIAEAGRGEAFILQGGDCAETFKDFGAKSIKMTLSVILQMTVVLMHDANTKVVKIGRIAGQFAKPRSSANQKKDGVTLPSYRGDIINGFGFSEEERRPDPKRMIQAYSQSASTINFLRSLATGGYADLQQTSAWLLDFVKNSPAREKYEKLAQDIQKTLKFMENCDDATSPGTKQASMYTSHEALLLDYEEALFSHDCLTGAPVVNSGHMLWIGDRTRQVDGAHVEFLRGVDNPIGIKCGPSMTHQELHELLRVLNPENEEGKITLIARFGKDKVKDHLPHLINVVRGMKSNVTWVCDPMHGNGKTLEDGTKTRDYKDIMAELGQFFEVCTENEVIPGGVHLEMTGRDVTECLGGERNVTDLTPRYETTVDPRLNDEQSLDLAFGLSDIINNSRPKIEAIKAKLVTQPKL